jgi:hypothetical protein
MPCRSMAVPYMIVGLGALRAPYHIRPQERVAAATNAAKGATAAQLCTPCSGAVRQAAAPAHASSSSGHKLHQATQLLFGSDERWSMN